MKKILAATLFSVLSAGVIAAEQCDNPGGYWRTVTVEVCDTRTVYVDVDKTRCEYEYTIGNPRDTETKTVTLIDTGHIQCDAAINVRVPDTNRDLEPDDPRSGVEYVSISVGLTTQTHYTEQQTSTEQYNCRLEEEQVWVESCDDGRNGRD